MIGLEIWTVERVVAIIIVIVVVVVVIRKNGGQIFFTVVFLPLILWIICDWIKIFSRIWAIDVLPAERGEQKKFYLLTNILIVSHCGSLFLFRTLLLRLKIQCQIVWLLLNNSVIYQLSRVSSCWLTCSCNYWLNFELDYCADYYSYFSAN